MIVERERWFECCNIERAELSVEAVRETMQELFGDPLIETDEDDTVASRGVDVIEDEVEWNDDTAVVEVQS